MPSSRISPPKNELIAYRRHTLKCGKPRPTFDPAGRKAEKEADTCLCPIVVSGRLAQEPKRIRHLALLTNDWNEARSRIVKLLDRQRIELPRNEPITTAGPVTVEAAVGRFLTSRGPASPDPIEPATIQKYEVLLQGRLLPWCDQNTLTDVRALENRDTVSRFIESWRNLDPRRNPDGDVLLSPNTRTVEIQRLRVFLEFCRDNRWISENPARKIKIGKKKKDIIDSDDGERHGLELDEYERVLTAFVRYPKAKYVRTGDLTAEHVYAAVELMRWAGLRISDCTKFDSSELKRNLENDGWVAHFIQQKTGKRCVSPVPDHVADLLLKLPPLYVGGGKRYWFWKRDNSMIDAAKLLAEKIMKVFHLAQDPDQNGKYRQPFAHYSTPHCLRHTFAIQHLNNGVDIELVSKWLGHESTAVTRKHYLRWIRSTSIMSQRAAKESYQKQIAKIELLANPVGVQDRLQGPNQA